MPIYEISEKGNEVKRLVKADSAAQAIRHCAHDRFAARTVSRVEDAADLMASGVKLETAGAEPVVEAERQPDGQGQGGDGEGQGQGDESGQQTATGGKGGRAKPGAAE